MYCTFDRDIVESILPKKKYRLIAGKNPVSRETKAALVSYRTSVHTQTGTTSHCLYLDMLLFVPRYHDS